MKQTSWLALIPVTLLLCMSYDRRWMSDDAFINVRIVQNILAGNGPVFNLTERVEAYSNPLWVGILTLWGALGGSLEHGAVWMGWTLSGLGLGAACWGAHRFWFGRAEKKRAISLPLGAMVVACLPVFWDFSTSGLEMGLALFWLGLSFAVLTTEASCPSTYTTRRRLGWAFLGLGPLIRPDLALFTLSFVGLALFLAGRTATSSPTRARLEIAAWAFALPLAYQVFRMGYFAGLVPNTALAKEAGMTHWSQGWAYLKDFLAPYWLLFPLGLLGAGWVALLRRQTTASLLSGVILSTALVHAFFVVKAGGGFMHGRFLLPTLFALLLPLMVAPLPFPRRRRLGFWLRAGAAALVLGWSVWCCLALRVPYEGKIGSYGIADERGFYVRTAKHPNPITLQDFQRHFFHAQGYLLAQMSHALQTRTPSPDRPWISEGVVYVDYSDNSSQGRLPQEEQQIFPLNSSFKGSVSMVAGRWSVGLAGCAAGLDIHVMDRRGVTDPLAGRLRLTARGRPGHEKEISNAWMIARFSDGSNASPEVQRIRASLAQEPLRGLLEAVESPLSSRRFFRNILNSPRFHLLRIDG